MRLLSCAVAAVMVTPLLAQDAAKAGPKAKYTEGGTERCLTCHGGARMILMAKTAHGDLQNKHSPYARQGCESCHGPGSLHVSRARGGEGFPALTRFKRGEPMEQQNGACLACHANDMGDMEGIAWAGNVHDTGQMTCMNCHQGHVAEDPMSDPEQQSKACTGCHKEQIAKHETFPDGLTCFDCHDVH